MKKSTRLTVNIYGTLWAGIIPLLAMSPRIRQGIRNRLLLKHRKRQFDIWIQAASGGEAYLALELLKKLLPHKGPSVIITSWTSQGLSILNDGIKRLPREEGQVATSFFPFDLPWLMKKALEAWKPRVVVLLETEIWPGMLYACIKKRVPTVILNGRLSPKSLNAYMKLKPFFFELSPSQVFAVSYPDGQRFAELFGRDRVKLMNNIKFDRMNLSSCPWKWAPLVPIKDKTPFIIMGSVRKEEERDVGWVIKKLLETRPHTIIGLFPRHMHRIDVWKRRLDTLGIRWTLRSKWSWPVLPGTVIIWDRFGELSRAYGEAHAVFVGGSLEPCGGQNFLEPLSMGIIPCIGPFYENFEWVGEDIFRCNLVTKVKDREELLHALLEKLNSPINREETIEQAKAYIGERQGGTIYACKIIKHYIDKKETGF